MDRIRQLEADRDERRKAVAEILKAADKDKRNLTDDEVAASSKLEAELDQIEATLKLERKRDEWERTSAPAIDRHEPSDPKPAGEAVAAVAPKGTGWLQPFGQFLQRVANAYQPGLVRGVPQAAVTGLGTSVPSDGGFLIEEQFSLALLNKAMGQAVLAPRCFAIPIGDGYDGIEYPYIEETSRVAGSRWGGVRVYRRAEAETVTASKPKFGRFDLRLEDLMGICYATERSLQDATSLAAIISKAFADEFAFTIDDEILNGTGAGQALGILNSPAKVTVAKEGGQAATSIVLDNLSKMRSRMPARLRGGAVWLTNQDTEPQFLKLSMPVGTGGLPVYLQGNTIANNPYDTLWGTPVIPIEQAQTLGTEGDIVYANLGEYALITKGGLQVAESMHVRFIYGENTFRFIYRVNGAPLWKSALTPAKGSNTLSPFVTLATRS